MSYKRKVKIQPVMKTVEELEADASDDNWVGNKPKTRKTRNIVKEKDSVVAGPSGARSSKTNLYYHDVPTELYRRIALRHTVGHKKHNDNPVPITMNLNWRQGLDDPFYVMDRLNHMFEHMIAFLEDGDTTDDNLGAIVWNAGFLMEVERLSPALINQVIGQCKYHGTGDIASSAEGKKKDLQIVQKVQK